MSNVKQTTDKVKPLNRVIQIDEAKIQSHQGKVVRNTVEETLNSLVSLCFRYSN